MECKVTIDSRECNYIYIKVEPYWNVKSGDYYLNDTITSIKVEPYWNVKFILEKS